MSIHLGDLYHWAPSRLRKRIAREGLVPRTEMPGADGEECDFAPGCWRVCLGTTPSSAWGLLPDTDGEESWDLWQVRLEAGDSARIRGDHLPYVREVQVNNGLPADRVWWVGERDGTCRFE